MYFPALSVFIADWLTGEFGWRWAGNINGIGAGCNERRNLVEDIPG
jgi:hypothetical protein